MTSKVVCIVLCVLLEICGRGHSDEGGLPVRKDAESSAPQTQGVQGRPGKIDPGVPGAPGPVGSFGNCTCDFRGMEELREQVQVLRDQVALLNLLSDGNHNKATYCSVGMKDGKILDSQITASSIFNNAYMAAHGRLDNTPSDGDGGVWAPHQPPQGAGEWLQVDLLTPVRVTGVVTQGSSDIYSDWITSYKIQYGNTISTLLTIKDEHGNDKVFQGNTDRNSYVIHGFPDPLVARYFRLIVQSYHGAVSLRMDYVTC